MTYKSLFRSVGPSPLAFFVCRSVTLSFLFAFLSCLKVEKFKYNYSTDVNAPAQLITVPTQLITAPAQPPATGIAVYTALLIYLVRLD